MCCGEWHVILRPGGLVTRRLLHVTLAPLLCILVSAFVFASPHPVTILGQTPALTLTKDVLADGVYLFRSPSALDFWTATNVVVIVNEDDVTVFDTFTRIATNRMLIAEIRALTNTPVRTLINSHWHMDHWSGNDQFVKEFP